MQLTTILPVAGLIIAGILSVVVLILWRLQQKEERITKSKKVSGNGKNHLYAFFWLFTHVPLLDRYFRKVLRTVEKLYPADQLSINKKATTMMLKKLGLTAAIIIVITIISGGDIFYIAMGIFAAIVLFDYSLTHTLENMEMELLEQLQSFLSDVRHYYMQSMILVDAVGDTLDDIPFEISLHIQKLYDILNSPIMEEKVEEYVQSDPNRFFLLLTSICTVVSDKGDAEKIDNSTFLDSIAYLKEEVNTELLKLRNRNYKFKFLCTMSLMMVFFIKPIESWAIGNMPDLEEFYSGIAGKSLMISTFILSFICYKLVEILRDSKRGELKRYSVWGQIGKIPFVSRFYNRIINRHYTKALKLNDDLKEVGDQTGPKAFLIQSTIVAIAAFILINFMFTAGIVGKKVTMLRDFTASFDSQLVPNQKYLEVMQGASQEYAQLYKGRSLKSLDEDELTKEIYTNSSVTNKEYARLVAQEVISQIAAYKNTYYKWWHLIIAIIGAVIAFFIPYAILKFKIWVATMNKDDEVNQFQTLVLVLMYTNGIKLDDILEWMDRFAYSFKASIETCITEIESGERKALEKMKRSETFQPFKRFVDCLLEIDSVGVAKAFDEVQSDRAYSLKNREQQNSMIVDERSKHAGLIAIVPGLFLLFTYLMGPMIIYAVRMYFTMDFTI